MLSWDRNAIELEDLILEEEALISGLEDALSLRPRETLSTIGSSSLSSFEVFALDFYPHISSYSSLI